MAKAIISFQQRGNTLGPNFVDEKCNNHSSIAIDELDPELDKKFRGNGYKPLTKTNGPFGYINDHANESEFNSVSSALKKKYGKGEHSFKGGIYKIIFIFAATIGIGGLYLLLS